MPIRPLVKHPRDGLVAIWDQPSPGPGDWVLVPPGVCGITLSLQPNSSGVVEMTSRVDVLTPGWTGAGYNWGTGVVTTTATAQDFGGAVQGATAVRLNITAGSGSMHVRMP